MIHHQTTGTGSHWLVFVHGLSCDSSDWSHQLEAFQGDYKCLTVDLRGHGKSATHAGPLDIETHAADVIRVLRTLNIESAVLVGHSMGTRVIAAAAIQAPECVAALVFVDGSIQGRGDPLKAADDIVALIKRDTSITTFARNMFSMMFTGNSDASVQKRIIDRAARMNPDRLVEQLRLMMMWDAGRMEAVLSQIEIPLTLLQSTTVGADKKRTMLKAGESSPYLETVKRLVLQVNTRIIPDCGHFTQVEAVEETNRAIRECASLVSSHTKPPGSR